MRTRRKRIKREPKRRKNVPIRRGKNSKQKRRKRLPRRRIAKQTKPTKGLKKTQRRQSKIGKTRRRKRSTKMNWMQSSKNLTRIAKKKPRKKPLT